MKRRRDEINQAFRTLLTATSLAFLSCDRPAADPATPQPAPPMTNSAPASNAPIGIYLSSPIQELELKSDGTYEARAELGSQSGTWKWDADKKEFSLERTSGELPYALRRLRVDRDDPEVLQWIPVPAISPEAGAIDYVRFKRKND